MAGEGTIYSRRSLLGALKPKRQSRTKTAKSTGLTRVARSGRHVRPFGRVTRTNFRYRQDMLDSLLPETGR
jgi:hypothetical protein